MKQSRAAGRDEFQTAIQVSRETLDRIDILIELLKKWQTRINLVSANSLATVWRRHILDSAQLTLDYPENIGVLTDMGSGAGFPGLILAIMRTHRTHLIESNQKKCAFLREAARLCHIDVHVHDARVESLIPWPSDVVTARAVAPLDRLIGMAKPFLAPIGGLCIFPKGAQVGQELTAAHKRWMMRVESRASLSDPDGVVLKITDIRRMS